MVKFYCEKYWQKSKILFIMTMKVNLLRNGEKMKNVKALREYTHTHTHTHTGILNNNTYSASLNIIYIKNSRDIMYV